MEKETKKKETKKVEKKEIKKTTATKKAEPKKTTTTKKVEAKKAVSKKKETVKKPEVKKTVSKTKTLVKASAINSAPKLEESNTREIDIKELKKIVEEEKAKEIRIPDLEGKKVEDGKKILEEANIRYEEETEKVYSLKIGKGKIVKTEPEKGKEYKDKKVVIYESKSKALMLIMALVLLVVGLTGLTYGRDIVENINEQIIKMGGGIGKPKISVKGGWQKEELFKIVKDAPSSKKIEYYEYCVVEKVKDECEWKKTYTKNGIITRKGHGYVKVRGVNEEGRIGKEAVEEVYVDPEAPEVEEVKVKEIKETEIKVETKALDKLSGIEKYMYSIDGKTYIEGGAKYTYTNLEANKEYIIYVKVIDKVGNETEVGIKVRTKKE